MGIPLLWPELYEHAHEVSLKGLHVFLTKKESKIRLGIDISVWMSHAIVGKEFLLLRTIFIDYANWPLYHISFQSLSLMAFLDLLSNGVRKRHFHVHLPEGICSVIWKLE